MTTEAPPVDAMVFVRSDRLLDAGLCIEYCLTLGYNMRGVIRDDWQKAVQYLYSGKCGVLVVADERTLNPDRTPRVEVVAYQQAQPSRPDVPAGRRGGKTAARPGRTERRTRTARIIRQGAEA